jgi:hypothetical protein
MNGRCDFFTHASHANVRVRRDANFVVDQRQSRHECMVFKTTGLSTRESSMNDMFVEAPRLAIWCMAKVNTYSFTFERFAL